MSRGAAELRDVATAPSGRCCADLAPVHATAVRGVKCVAFRRRRVYRPPPWSWEGSCPTGIRTPTNRSRVCRATVTPSGREVPTEYSTSGRLRQPIRLSRTRNGGGTRGAGAGLTCGGGVRQPAAGAGRAGTILIHYRDCSSAGAGVRVPDRSGRLRRLDERAGAYRAAHRGAVRDRNPLARGAPRHGSGGPGGVRGYRHRPSAWHLPVRRRLSGLQPQGGLPLPLPPDRRRRRPRGRPAWSWMPRSTCRVSSPS